MVGEPDARKRPMFGVTTSQLTELEPHAHRIEELGFDYLAVGEHVSFLTPVPNCFVSLAYAAAVTSRVRLISTVVQLPLYPAALVAKMSAVLDVVSGGRFELGIGVAGENEPEFAACGVRKAERGARSDEALEIIRRLWTGKPVDFDGRFAQLRDVAIAPAPVQPSGPPIWVSGRHPAAARRAATWADGWLPYMYSPEMFARSMGEIAALRAESGYTRPPIRGGAVIFTVCHSDADQAAEMALRHLGRQYAQDFARVASSYLIVGTPEQCRQRVDDFIAAGCDLIIFASACPPDYLTTNERLIAEDVLGMARV
jgi:probable F420-dependent oxidoreductase